ncbi:hypothetical protein EDD36DRAFT_498516 [Exophiala viscosa]|uniref:FAD-binding PCMH-type domain-containing protein n=1 Tax=Exophiala viscosa TaxID=2486360 RepID=A0AAN6DQX8_9EURO|nr:hypothetical protein EDD36DRAFT_498516 [Exophiala viscosa]
MGSLSGVCDGQPTRENENSRVLPAGIDSDTFDKAFDAVALVIGEENVSRTHEYGGLEGPQGEKWYGDHYEMRGAGRNTPSGAFRPKTVEEIQHIMKIANEYNLPLWVFSRGKNLGYGCTSGVEKGTVMLDLNRMKKIIEVNEEYAYAIVEPGVSFFDLHDYIKEPKIKLWISCPALGWGSVLGNTTERGFGYTQYGEHSQAQCGMEVVLPNGEIIRSGMGAMENSDMWALFKGGYGPSIDGLFFQSNLGIVTKMGIHLQPAPRHFVDCEVSVPNEEDLLALTSTIARLERSGVIQNHASISNSYRQTIFAGPDTWGPLFPYWAARKAVPYAVLNDIREAKGWGFWKAEFALYGSQHVCDAAWREAKEAFEVIPGVKFNATPQSESTLGGPLVPSEMIKGAIPHSGLPVLDPLELMKIRGKGGAHTCFSPLFPPNSRQLHQWYLRSKALVEEAGIDYFSDFHVYGRYVIAIIVLIYGPEDGPRIDKLYKDLMEDAAKESVSEYRTHIDYMDDIAGHYNWNDGAQRRFLQAVKDLTDPRGVLNQGKSGLWNAGKRKTTR